MDGNPIHWIDGLGAIRSFGTALFERRQEPFDFGALRGAGREAPQQFAGLSFGLGTLSRLGQGECQGEPRLVQVRVR